MFKVRMEFTKLNVKAVASRRYRHEVRVGVAIG